MNKKSFDTIAAIATAPGLGGIAIVRMSGQEALNIASSMLQTHQHTRVLFKPRFMHLAQVQDQHQNILDEVLTVYMPGPHSATGEDVVEIHCHGGTGVSTGILESCLARGARLADAGEFTRRAFLLGRIDLTQAEAVAELIHAPTATGARLAEAKLQGLFGKKIASIRQSIDALRIQTTLAVDFPEEDAELLSAEAFTQTSMLARAEIATLLASYERARLWREGIGAVLIGQVNAGKSSLFNALLGRDRAIVSNLAGTTRDYLEETINLQGLPIRILDTAGLRHGEDQIETEGIARSLSLAKQADIVFLVVDAQKGLQKEEFDFLATHAKNTKNTGITSDGQEHMTAKNVLIILNKVDLLDKQTTWPQELSGYPCVAVSAREGCGIEQLGDIVKKMVLSTAGQAQTTDLAPNMRQSQLLQQADLELQALLQAIAENMPADILGVHLDFTVHLLDSITGTTDNEALLDKIFSTFCIGK